MKQNLNLFSTADEFIPSSHIFPLKHYILLIFTISHPYLLTFKQNMVVE